MIHKMYPMLDYVLVRDLLPGDVIVTSGQCLTLIVSVLDAKRSQLFKVFMVNEHGRVLERSWYTDTDVALLWRSSNCAP